MRGKVMLERSAPASRLTSVLTGRVWGLDVLRAVAASLVAFHHFALKSPVSHPVIDAGWIGVEIFFVISGMMIAQSCLGKTALDFAVGRILRLYPVVLLCTTISVLLFWMFGSVVDLAGVDPNLRLGAIVRSYLLIGNVFILYPYWTLPIELAFYAVIVVAALLFHIDLRRIAKGLILWSVPYLSLLTLFYVFGVGYDVDLGSSARFNVFLMRHGAFFGLGILLAVPDPERRRQRMWVGLALLLCAAEVVCHARYSIPFYAHATDLPEIATAGLLLFAAGLGWIIVSLRDLQHRALGPISQRWIKRAGLASFPFYLLHESVGHLVVSGLIGRGVGTVVSWVIGYGAAAIVSLIVVVYVEPRVRALFRSALERGLIHWFRLRSHRRLNQPYVPTV